MNGKLTYNIAYKHISNGKLIFQRQISIKHVYVVKNITFAIEYDSQYMSNIKGFYNYKQSMTDFQLLVIDGESESESDMIVGIIIYFNLKNIK